MDATLEPINGRLDKVDSRLDTMLDSIDTLKQDMATINHEVIPLVKGLYDGMIGTNRQVSRLDEIEAVQETTLIESLPLNWHTSSAIR